MDGRRVRLGVDEYIEVQRMPDGSFLICDPRSLKSSSSLSQRSPAEVDGQIGDFQAPATPLTLGTIESHVRKRLDAAAIDLDSDDDGGNTSATSLLPDYQPGNALDLDTLLPVIVSRAVGLVGAHCGVILLADSRGEMVPGHVEMHPGKKRIIGIPYTTMETVVRDRTSVLSTNAIIDSRFCGAHSITMQSLRTAMTVPLLHAGRVLGLLHVESPVATMMFAKRDLRACTRIAAQAAALLQNTIP